MAQGVGITVDSKKVQRALRVLIKELGADRVLKDLGIATETAIDFNFIKERNDQGKWKPLAESTKKSRRKGDGTRGPMILQDVGILKNSMTHNVNGKTSVDVGTNVPYGRYHQEGVRRSSLPSGTRRTRRAPRLTAFRIPKRPFLPSAKFAEQDIAKRVIDGLFAEIKRKMESSGRGAVV